MRLVDKLSGGRLCKRCGGNGHKRRPRRGPEKLPRFRHRRTQDSYTRRKHRQGLVPAGHFQGYAVIHRLPSLPLFIYRRRDVKTSLLPRRRRPVKKTLGDIPFEMSWSGKPHTGSARLPQACHCPRGTPGSPSQPRAASAPRRAGRSPAIAGRLPSPPGSQYVGPGGFEAAGMSRLRGIGTRLPRSRTARIRLQCQAVRIGNSTTGMRLSRVASPSCEERPVHNV